MALVSNKIEGGSILKRLVLFACILFFPVLCFADTHIATEPDTLSFLNWPEYMDPELIKSFEKQFNARVQELFFETDETKEAMILSTGGKGLDVVLSSGFKISRYIKQN